MEYELTMYHGGKTLRKSDLMEFKPKNKKGRQVYGVGFYTIASYREARNYGRTVNAINLVLNKNNISNVIEVQVSELMEFVRTTFTMKFYKQFESVFKDKDKISLRRFYAFLDGNLKGINRYQKEINELFVKHNAKYSIEYAFGTYIVIVHDFDIINNVQKSESYDDVEIPEELIKLSCIWI